MVEQPLITKWDRMAEFSTNMFAAKPSAMAAWLSEKEECGYCGASLPRIQMRKYTNRRRDNRVHYYCDYGHLRDGELMFNALAEYGGSLAALLADTQPVVEGVDEKGRTIVTATGDFAYCKCGCGQTFPVAREGRKREFVDAAHRMRYMRMQKAHEAIASAVQDIEAEQAALDREIEAEIAANAEIAQPDPIEVVEIRNDENGESTGKKRGRKPRVYFQEPLPNGTYVFPAGKTFPTTVARRLSFPKVGGWRYRCVCGAKAGSMDPFPTRERAEFAWQMHFTLRNHEASLRSRREGKLTPVTLQKCKPARIGR